MVNWMLLILVVGVVLVFKKFDNLVVVYGIVVIIMMVIIMVFVVVVMCLVWCWYLVLVMFVSFCFLVVDMVFFLVNFLKICDGGWFLLMLGVGVFFLLMIWYKGKKFLWACSLEDGILFELFLVGLLVYLLYCVEGMVVFFIGNIEFVLVLLLYNFKYNCVFYECVIFISFVMCDIFYVDDKYCVFVCDLGSGIYIVKVEYGFKEMLDVYCVFEFG